MHCVKNSKSDWIESAYLAGHKEYFETMDAASSAYSRNGRRTEMCSLGYLEEYPQARKRQCTLKNTTQTA